MEERELLTTRSADYVCAKAVVFHGSDPVEGGGYC